MRWLDGYVREDWRTDAPQETRRDCLARAGIIALSAILGVLLMLLTRPGAQTTSLPVMAPPAQASFGVTDARQDALPGGVRAGLPGGEMVTLTRSLEELAQGKMMVIDENHPLPERTVPETYGVLSSTGGRVTCRDTCAVSGRETLTALEALFTDARACGMTGLTVFAGTRSMRQQLTQQTDAFALLSRSMTLENALEEVRRTIPSPGCSEHQSAFAVDIRVCPVPGGAPDDAPLADSASGRWLIENCWRYGLIWRGSAAGERAEKCRAYHFRYVGQVHAALLHALQLPLEAYLALLHEKGALTLYNEENAPVASAVCVAAGERVLSFTVPAGSLVDDASEDNLGYAVVALTYGEM